MSNNVEECKPVWKPVSEHPMYERYKAKRIFMETEFGTHYYLEDGLTTFGDEEGDTIVFGFSFHVCSLR